MAKVLVINSSVRSDDSISRELTARLADRIEVDNNEISHRDLTGDIHLISEQSLSAVAKASEDRSSEERDLASLADALIEELELADYLIIGSPMYNFGPAASLKAWADLVARSKRTFTYTDAGPAGLLKIKKAFVIAVTGGTAVGSNIDFMTPWLKHFLTFIGISNIEMITADGIYGPSGAENIRHAKETIDGLTLKGVKNEH